MLSTACDAIAAGIVENIVFDLPCCRSHLTPKGISAIGVQYICATYENAIVVKMIGWRTNSYPIEISVDDKAKQQYQSC